jgi:DNA invertase Pin-like site-specific DNA recombinase
MAKCGLFKMKYFLYARKSTDSEERQIKSIDDQISELKEFATIQKIEIVLKSSFSGGSGGGDPARCL